MMILAPDSSEQQAATVAAASFARIYVERHLQQQQQQHQQFQQQQQQHVQVGQTPPANMLPTMDSTVSSARPEREPELNIGMLVKKNAGIEQNVSMYIHTVAAMYYSG